MFHFPSSSTTLLTHHTLRSHLYALYCLIQRQIAGNLDPSPNEPAAPTHTMPWIFTDGAWETLGTSILSTSNCGNPALRLFGFGPVVADGYRIGYIIKEDRLSLCVLLC